LAKGKDKKVFGVISKIDDNYPFREQSSGNIVSYFEYETISPFTSKSLDNMSMRFVPSVTGRVLFHFQFM